MGDLLNAKKYEIFWKGMWKKNEKEVQRAELRLAVREENRKVIAVYDAIRSQIDANINTHRTIWISQEKNGKLSEKELLNSLEGTKRIKVEGNLQTADGKSGIADAKVSYGDFKYDVIFTDLPIYTEETDALYETGGIVNGDIHVKGNKILKSNLLCTGTVYVPAEAELIVEDGVTLVYDRAVINGSLKGFITGNLCMGDGGEANCFMLAGTVSASGHSTLIGMYYGDSITVEEGATLHMKQFGSLTSTMETKSGVTLLFEDAEPLVLGMNQNEWHINSGHTGGDAGFVGTNTTGNSWYNSCRKTPTDMLGRLWTPLMEGNGVLMPDMCNIGLMKVTEDLEMKVVNNTDHNYALFMMNNLPLTHIHGAIHIHAIEGVACPPQDVEALDVSEVQGDGSEAAPYYVECSRKDSAYEYISAESIAVQAATKKVLLEHFKDIDMFDWQYAPIDSVYTWFGYPKGATQEHWDGPTGNEKYIVKVIQK